jgi:hypothetical protein
MTNGNVTPESPEVEPITPQQTDQDAAQAASLRVHFAMAIEGLLKVADRENAVPELSNIVTGLQPTEKQRLRKLFLELSQNCRDPRCDGESDAQVPVALPIEVGDAAAELSPVSRKLLCLQLVSEESDSLVIDEVEETATAGVQSVSMKPHVRNSADTRFDNPDALPPMVLAKKEHPPLETKTEEESHTSSKRGCDTVNTHGIDPSHADKAFKSPTRDGHKPTIAQGQDATGLVDCSKQPLFTGMITPQETLLKIDKAASSEDHPTKKIDDVAETSQQDDNAQKPETIDPLKISNSLENPHSLASMSTSEFAKKSLRKVEELGQPEANPQMYKDFYNELNQAQSTKYCDGSQWVKVLASWQENRQRNVLHYSLTSICFSRWHHSQTELEGSTKAAAERVSERVLQSAVKCNQRRKNLNTHLARGRKWKRLVDELGMGILLVDAWYVSPIAS